MISVISALAPPAGTHIIQERLGASSSRSLPSSTQPLTTTVRRSLVTFRTRLTTRCIERSTLHSKPCILQICILQWRAAGSEPPRRRHGRSGHCCCLRSLRRHEYYASACGTRRANLRCKQHASCFDLTDLHGCTSLLLPENSENQHTAGRSACILSKPLTTRASLVLVCIMMVRRTYHACMYMCR